MAIDLSTGFKILGQDPIDERLVVTSRTAVNSHEAYIGLVVYDTTDTKLYILKAADPSVSANWEEVGAAGTQFADQDALEAFITDKAAFRTDVSAVGLTGDETVAGDKTFSGDTSFTSSIIIPQVTLNPDPYVPATHEGTLHYNTSSNDFWGGSATGWRELDFRLPFAENIVDNPTQADFFPNLLNIDTTGTLTYTIFNNVLTLGSDAAVLPEAPSRDIAAMKYELLVPGSGSDDPLSWVQDFNGGIPDVPAETDTATLYELRVPETGSTDAVTWVESTATGSNVPNAPAAGSAEVTYTLTVPASGETDPVVWENILDRANVWTGIQDFTGNTFVTYGTDDSTDTTATSRLVLSTVRQADTAKNGLAGTIDFTLGQGPNRGTDNAWDDNILSSIESNSEVIGAIAETRGTVTIKNRPEGATKEALIDSASFSTNEQTLNERLVVESTASVANTTNVVEIYNNVNVGEDSELLGGSIEWRANLSGGNTKMTPSYADIKAVLEDVPAGVSDAFKGSLELTYGSSDDTQYTQFASDYIVTSNSIKSYGGFEIVDPSDITNVEGGITRGKVTLGDDGSVPTFEINNAYEDGVTTTDLFVQDIRYSSSNDSAFTVNQQTHSFTTTGGGNANYEEKSIVNSNLETTVTKTPNFLTYTNPVDFVNGEDHFTIGFVGGTGEDQIMYNSLRSGVDLNLMSYLSIEPGGATNAVRLSNGTLTMGAGGTTPYTFPNARGTDGQVLAMQTDLSVAWEDPAQTGMTIEGFPDNRLTVLAVDSPLTLSGTVDGEALFGLNSTMEAFNNSSIVSQGADTTAQYRTAATDISGSSALDSFIPTADNNITASVLSTNSGLSAGSTDVFAENIDPAFVVATRGTLGNTAGPKFEIHRHTGNQDDQRLGTLHFTAESNDGSKGSIAALRTYGQNLNSIGTDTDTSAGTFAIALKSTAGVLDQAYEITGINQPGGRFRHIFNGGVNGGPLMTIQNSVDEGTSVKITLLRGCGSLNLGIGDVCLTDQAIGGQGSNTGIFALGLKAT